MSEVRKVFNVVFNSLEVKPDPVEEMLMTTVWLELRGTLELDFLKQAHKLSQKPTNGTNCLMALLVRERTGLEGAALSKTKDGGATRKIRFTSKGSKTKNYSFAAVLEKFWDEHDRLDTLFSSEEFELELEVRIVQEEGLFDKKAQNPLEEFRASLAEMDQKSGMVTEVEFSSRGKSVKITAEGARSAARALRKADA